MIPKGCAGHPVGLCGLEVSRPKDTANELLRDMNKFVPYEDRAASLPFASRTSGSAPCSSATRTTTQRDLDLRKVNVYWWHRLLGFTHAGATLNPFPPPLALLVALLWATERRVRGFASRLAPPAAGGDKERILHIPANTGMGDLLCQPSLMLYAARMLGFKKLAVDWRRSSYLTDRRRPLRGALRCGEHADAEVVPIGQVDAARRARPREGLRRPRRRCRAGTTAAAVSARRSHWRLPRPFPLTPNDTWWDALLAETPPPFQFRGCRSTAACGGDLPRRARLCRRDPAQATVPPAVRGIRAAGATLQGAATIGVHVRHGNGESASSQLGRGLIAIAEAAVERACPHRALLPSQSAAHDFVMSDSRVIERTGSLLRLRRVVSASSEAVRRRRRPSSPARRPPLQRGAGVYTARRATARRRRRDRHAVLAACDVFLATSHSMFTFYPAKLGQPMGRVQAVKPRRPRPRGCLADRALRQLIDVKLTGCLPRSVLLLASSATRRAPCAESSLQVLR